MQSSSIAQIVSLFCISPRVGSGNEFGEREVDDSNQIDLRDVACRAGQLMQIYQGLTTPNLEQELRIAVIMRAKLAVKGSDAPVAAELVQLLDRESDLTLRCGHLNIACVRVCICCTLDGP